MPSASASRFCWLTAAGIASFITLAQNRGHMRDTTPPVSSLEAAAAQLDSALTSLERKLDDLFESVDAAKPSEREADALRRDRMRLATDLDAARAREKELQALADEASAALGAAIQEVRDALNKV